MATATSLDVGMAFLSHAPRTSWLSHGSDARWSAVPMIPMAIPSIAPCIERVPGCR